MSSNALLDGRGQLWVVSAPSGTGKTTVVDRLMERITRLRRSRSYTSRAARPGEADAVDYNFVSRQRFEEMVREDAFLEWADIFGNLYGTSRAETEAALAAGIDLILVIDVQGARQVRERLPEATAIFVLPPSFEVLASRLRGRNKDPETSIVRRLATARQEIDAVEEYDYVVVNDELERCVAELDAIIAAERAKLSRRRAAIAPILATFKA
jgi:guanylate kinase